MSQAVVFPGQGSQFVGMLKESAEKNPIIKETFVSVSDHLGFDVWALTQQGPEEVLNQTMYTQVAMLTADVALFRGIDQQHVNQFQWMAGHSLGEYAALVCAGAVSLLDAAVLVQTRGRLMQETVPTGLGGMAAIVGLNDEQVKAVCERSSILEQQVSAANYNAIGQVVIAGHLPAVQRAILMAEAQGARLARIIPVSVPCHCALLKPAAEQFAEALAATPFQPPTVPVISNVNLSVYQSAQQIRDLLKQQLYSPVRWVETIQYLAQQGVDRISECGPGKVLTGLIKRIDPSIQVVSIL